MSDWITLTIATRNGGRARVRRDAITCYRDGAYTDGPCGERLPCRFVFTADNNMAVTETMDELRALIEGTNAREAPYGYCPTCGAPGEIRERRPNGNDQCANWHQYPSRDALPEPPKDGEKS